MASAVDICNLALGHLGNKAAVISIDPPDGSIESGLCYRFFGISRDEVLEGGDWTFARTRAALSLLTTNPSSTWAYAYALPSDCITPRRIVTGAASAREDDSIDFSVEGTTLLTNQQNAVLIYTRVATDVALFSPGFVTAMSYKLGAYLAGPILKGEAGANTAKTLHGVAKAKILESMSFDANREWRTDDPPFAPSAISARNGVPGSTTPSNTGYVYANGYVVS